MKRWFPAVLCSLIVTACATASQPSGADATAWTKVELVRCSPFKLAVQARSAGANGSVDLTFTADNGKLRGESSDTNLSGGVLIPGGEVKHLTINGRQVQFTSAGGSPYELILKEGCDLRGSFVSTRGRMQFDVFPR